MDPKLLPDRLWARIAPVLPAVKRTPLGRKPIDDRLVLTAVLYALLHGVSWDELPRHVGFGSAPLFQARRRLWTEEQTFWKIWRICIQERWRHTRRIAWERGPVTNRNGRFAPVLYPHIQRPKRTLQISSRGVQVRITA